MMTDYITFRSVTVAQRGEKILNAAGIRCAVRRTPRWMEEQGCGYCIRLSGSEVPDALALLRKNQLSWRKVYHQGEDGVLEERRV
ncbi:MAG: DUF3343 domain-containing protein [Faecousia sp.]